MGGGRGLNAAAPPREAPLLSGASLTSRTAQKTHIKGKGGKNEQKCNPAECIHMPHLWRNLFSGFLLACCWPSGGGGRSFLFEKWPPSRGNRLALIHQLASSPPRFCLWSPSACAFREGRGEGGVCGWQHPGHYGSARASKVWAKQQQQKMFRLRKLPENEPTSPPTCFCHVNRGTRG